MAKQVENLPAWDIQRKSGYKWVSTIDDAAWNSLEQRKAKGKNIYFDLYNWRQSQKDASRFCAFDLEDSERKELIKWIRDVDDSSSCQNLQILFSFSVPSPAALDFIVSLEESIISMGAGCGYWEFLLQKRGVDVICFDSNMHFSHDMRYTHVEEGGPEVLLKHTDRTLMISWPDTEASSTFSLDCLRHYNGTSIIHIGELFGETMLADPWGQSTSRQFQTALAQQFRCVSRVQLPNWPGHMDSVTLWHRADRPVNCEGALFQFIEVPGKKYF